MKLLITIEENGSKEVFVEMRRMDKQNETELEGETFDDIFDIIQYYVVGDEVEVEVEDTTNEIISTMFNQRKK
jgi:hypothetical protein